MSDTPPQQSEGSDGPSEFVNNLIEHVRAHNLTGEYTIQDNKDFGPSLVATRDFSIGDVVVRERAMYMTTADLLGSWRDAGSPCRSVIARLFKVDADSAECDLEIGKNAKLDTSTELVDPDH